MTEPIEIAERVLDIVGDRAEVVVAVSRGTHALTRFANSHIHQNVAEDTESVHLKAVVDARAAGSSINQTDDAALQRLVDRVIEAAAVRPPDPDWPGLAPPAPVPDVEHFDADTADAPPTARADVVKAFIDAGEGLEAAGYCSTAGSTVAFANSAGQRVQRRHSSATIDGIHRAGGGADGASHQSSSSLGEIDGASAGHQAADRARASLDAVDVDPGHYEVVLDRSCTADILQFLAYAGFNGKSHLEGTSFVHLGEQQFDKSVELWDDAADGRTVGLAFDTEGTPKQRVALVAEGITSAVVHDRRTAKRAGAESTGHAVLAEAFGAYPQNLFLRGGDSSVDDLVAGVSRGLLVCGFWYTRILDPRTQVVTGLTRNGLFLIEDGKVGPAVRNLRFTQSYVAALGPGKVLGIADDARLYNSFHVPSLHLASWNFTGGAKG